MSTDTVHIFGIRHHGPGSARSLIESLTALEPDCILLEGPPEGDSVMPLVTHEEMRPPVALLIYCPDDPHKAVYYPFATFSPEWQAMSFGLNKQIPVRFMDLPLSNWMAVAAAAAQPGSNGEESSLEGGHPAGCEHPDGQSSQEPSEETSEYPCQKPEQADNPNKGFKSRVKEDPLTWLAQAAGYSDGERWWEQLVEHRRSGNDVFAAISEAMTTLRQEFGEEDDSREKMREAHMRQTIRTAQKEGFKKIAVVCGAWHIPALRDLSPAKEDSVLLKSLPKRKVEATFIPWTHGRLSYESGYGAGVTSPGWYHHLWTCSDHISERWITSVAHLLRGEDLDASSAHIIEAVRLADSLAALRGRPLAGLTELSEAIQAVLCFGNDAPMRLIHDKLVVGEVLGHVPEDTPGIPLQKDLSKEQKRLRLAAEAGERALDLDLRKETDLDRSHLLHRLNLLNIGWGIEEKVSGKKGSFHELWKLRWMPEYSVALIEAGIWGRTVIEAATNFAHSTAEKTHELPELTALLNKVLLADLSDALHYVMERVQNEAAIASDIKHLMGALPPLVQTARYGNVRKTDLSDVEHVIDGLMARICVGLPAGCASLNDEAAADMFAHIADVHSAVLLLQKQEHIEDWQFTLEKLAETPNMHGLIAGRACRYLLETRFINHEEAARKLGLALSSANEPLQAASWAEGFLSGSGLLLIHDQELWNVIDTWVSALNDETFTQILPLLRRTFSTFQAPERRQMGQRVARSTTSTGKSKSSAEEITRLNDKRGELVLPILSTLLGLPAEGGDEQ